MPQENAPETSAEALLGPQPDARAIADYEEAGAIIVRGLISPEWLERLRATYGDMAQDAVIPYLKGKPAPGTRLLMNRHRMWEDFDAFRDFLFHSSIAHAAAALMRSGSATLYEDILLTEPAGQKAVLGWHQDAPTWPVCGDMMSSVWFSMQAVDAETGAMRFAKGSHRGPLYQPKSIKIEEAGEDARFWTGGTFPADGTVGEETILITPVEPGDAVIFHPRAIHTSYGSARDRARQTFTIRFLGDDIRWQPRRRLFHPWMNDLGLREGDCVVHPRLPLVWADEAASR